MTACSFGNAAVNNSTRGRGIFTGPPSRCRPTAPTPTAPLPSGRALIHRHSRLLPILTGGRGQRIGEKSVVPSLPSTVEMILMSLFRSAVMMLMAVALKNCKPTGAVFKRCFWLTAREVNRECPVLQLRRPVRPYLCKNSKMGCGCSGQPRFGLASVRCGAGFGVRCSGDFGPIRGAVA